MTLLVLAAIAVSTLAIFALCLGDPKRRRASRLPGVEQAVATRRLFAAIAVAPGLWCLLQGGLAAFFIWLGGCAIAGWLIALCFTQRTGRDHDGHA